MRSLLTLKFVSLAALMILTASVIAIAQDGAQTRSITSDDFASQRPSGSAGRSSKRSYRRVRAATFPTKTKRPKPRIKASEAKFTEIGVTMWKLRPPKTGEAGYLLPVLDDKKIRQMWLAERTDLDSIFKKGDKVRFAVESSEPAYLYVIDRETYADGSMGEPFMIFPESSRDHNAVGPGVLVDIPDQRDDNPYFNINPQKATYRGELLTIIISPKPLTELRTDSNGKVVDTKFLGDLEFGGEAELFSRADKADSLFSTTESGSMCGGRSRQADGSCGTKTRQLTREEPLPQSIYRVKTTKGQPAVAFVKLSVN